MKHARLLLTCMLWAVIATALKAQTNLSGSQVGEGTFYLKNVGTGLYLKFGGAENAKAAEGHAGIAVTLAKSGNGYTIETNAGYLNNDLTMTSTSTNDTEWTFKPVDDAYYQIISGDQVLASVNDENGLLELQAPIDGVSKQKWMLVTRNQLSTLFDMTPIIRAASFDRNDITESAWVWESSNNNTVKIESEKTGSDSENYYLHINGQATVTQDIGKNLRGSFALSFYAYCTNGSASVIIESHGEKQTIPITKSDKWERCTKQVMSIGNNANKNITLTITTGSDTKLYIDNFEIQYLTSEEASSDTFDEQEQVRYEERAKREIADILIEIESTKNDTGTDYFENVIDTLTIPNITNDSELREFLNEINQIKDNALNAKADPTLKDTQTEQNAETGFYPTITVSRTLKANTWSTFVVPFKMDKPEGWEVKTLTGSTLNNNNITLTFSNANTIEAGVPYMVRVQKEVSSIVGTNVTLKETLTNVSTEHVEFVGTYTKGYVPEGAFFISNNKFYRSAAENSNNINAFRAYFTTTTNAKALSYRTDDETDITEEIAEEVTVVAIYNLQGVRLDDMQEGVNILQMSNGNKVKVIIK